MQQLVGIIRTGEELQKALVAIERIKKDIKDGKALGVNSTPTFFVNGKMIVGGKNFKDEIQKILKPNAP